MKRVTKEEIMATVMRPGRQADQDVVRLRAVKEAAKRYHAAVAARDKADIRLGRAAERLEEMLGAASPNQEAYLRSIAGLPQDTRPE